MHTIALASVAFAKFTARAVYTNSPKLVVVLPELKVPKLFARATMICELSNGVAVCFTHTGLIIFSFVGFVFITGAVVPNGNTDCGGKLKVHLFVAYRIYMCYDCCAWTKVQVQLTTV